jgi:hypoxanthine phosphoribosyltransferase
MVNWSEYAEALSKLHEKLELHEFDDMAAIGRGGSIVAAYLSSKMGYRFSTQSSCGTLDTGLS